MSKAGFLCIFCVIVLLAACSTRDEGGGSREVREIVPAAELIRQADELYKLRENADKLREGIGLLKRARYADPRSFEANWKLAKFDFYLGDKSPDARESDRAFKEGIDAGQLASNIAPDKPDGYFWTGANLGGRARKSPLTEGLTSVGAIREAMNKTLEIQPDYQGASAYDALAQIELATGLTGGSRQQALEYLEKALALEQNNSNIHLHLAETYLALNRREEARKRLEYVLRMKPDPDYLPEYKDSIDQAKKLLETRF